MYCVHATVHCFILLLCVLSLNSAVSNASIQGRRNRSGWSGQTFFSAWLGNGRLFYLSNGKDRQIINRACLINSAVQPCIPTSFGQVDLAETGEKGNGCQEGYKCGIGRRSCKPTLSCKIIQRLVTGLLKTGCSFELYNILGQHTVKVCLSRVWQDLPGLCI